jgi:hypothetical protein
MGARAWMVLGCGATAWQYRTAACLSGRIALLATRADPCGHLNVEIPMRKTFGSTFSLPALLACFVILGASACAQEKASRPSPPAKAECKLSDGKTVTIDYGSPRVKGRKIFGDVVPYGKVWRAGANEATTFVTETDLTVGGTPVPAGSYTLFAIPEADKWTLIVSKTTGEWGTNYSGPSADLARIEMKASKLPSPMENFTIAFDQGGPACTLRMAWEATQASVVVAKK